jgi:hypothetical protein
MSSAEIAFTPVIAIRDSDEITAVWLVPQLVLLKSSQHCRHSAVPSGGVLSVEDKTGYTPLNDERPSVPRSHRQAGGSSSHEGRSVAFRFPFQRAQLYSAGNGAQPVKSR